MLACGCVLCSADEFVIDSVSPERARRRTTALQGPLGPLTLATRSASKLVPDGELYVTEVRNHQRFPDSISKTGELTTVAGCGRRGYTGDGGPAVEAEINEPYEVRFDNDGNMYFVEMKNHIVRRVDRKSKVITTFAGAGRAGFGGDGGLATEALLREPHSIAFDSIGPCTSLILATIAFGELIRRPQSSSQLPAMRNAGCRKTGSRTRRSHPWPAHLCIDDNTLWISDCARVTAFGV